jgi:hypothetical protein
MEAENLGFPTSSRPPGDEEAIRVPKPFLLSVSRGYRKIRVTREPSPEESFKALGYEEAILSRRAELLLAAGGSERKKNARDAEIQALRHGASLKLQKLGFQKAAPRVSRQARVCRLGFAGQLGFQS